jgi:hypothetical protein
MDRDASTVRAEGLAEARRCILNPTPNQIFLVVRYFVQNRIFVEGFNLGTAEQKAKHYSLRQPSVPTYVVSANLEHGVQRAVNGKLIWLPE